jgi:hypothetical protein
MAICARSFAAANWTVNSKRLTGNSCIRIDTVVTKLQVAQGRRTQHHEELFPGTIPESANPECSSFCENLPQTTRAPFLNTV